MYKFVIGVDIVKIRNVIFVTFIIYCILLSGVLLWMRFILNINHYLDAMTTLSLEDKLQKANLVPFKTIFGYIKSIDAGFNKRIVYDNIIGNLILFMPLGFYLPMFFKSMRKTNIFLPFIIVFLLGVECLQLLTTVGSFDVDDLILNFLGVACFWLITKFIIKINLFKEKAIK
jgi:glycopeptide antibiotics resistance protein